MERTFPYKVLEYGAAGLPILMTHVTPLSDLVRKYDAGIVVNKPDPASLSESLLDLLVDERKWVHASLNAQRLAEKYNVKKLAYREAMLLKEVMIR
jgi:glycosyltransferase involved in cell wall biosynthesis